MTVRVFPIRHHGPGSARALAAALDAWRPDAVLIEGPPEANGVLELAKSAQMRPPVALLAYLPARPAVSAFYPLAAWSPEWVAIQHALTWGAPVTMIDLPAAVSLHQRHLDGGPADGPGGAVGADPPACDENDQPDEPEPVDDIAPTGDTSPDVGIAGDSDVSDDPIARLAEAAGYDDAERWWEDVVEHRVGQEPWEAITEAMAELRSDCRTSRRTDTEIEARREASMRQHIRAAAKVCQRVAVVCGAWHAPALVEPGAAKPDQALLAGLPRERVAVTWVPWTNTRLAIASGYGAGVAAPGWYEHLFTSPDRPIERWMAKVAALLRAEQLDASPASVVDAVRLAETLATIRGRPLAGLSECTDAVRAVIGGGYDTALSLVGRQLVVGDSIGEVPPETPTVPLAADLAAQQRRLRLKPDATVRPIELDLRRDVDLRRSQLLHRLNLLDVAWGTAIAGSRGTGTFREEWQLNWQPELSVRVIEASVFGTTVEAAAGARAEELAGAATDVAAVTRLVEQCLLADLPAALPAVMAALDERSARSSDVGELMDAVPPLARVLRYGTVRRTDVAALDQVVQVMVARLCVSLAPATVSLDDEAASTITARISAVTVALASLDDVAMRRQWLDALAALSRAPHLHGLPAGRTTRIVLDAELLGADDVARRLSAALSRGEEPAHGAAWIEGLLAGSGLLLVHDRALLALIDEWVASVSGEIFDDVLPLLRRTFSLFEPGERRLIGDAASRLDGSGRGQEPARPGPAGDLGELDVERADAILPLLRALIGVEPTP